jgi:type VI protein secretion system component Hcp
MISRLLIPAIALFALGTGAIAQGPGTPPKGRPANMTYKLSLGQTAININSFQWGAGRGVGYTGGDYQTSNLSVSEVTITKELDSNTGPIFAALANFEAIPYAKVEGFLNGALVPVLTLEFYNARLTGFAMSAGTGSVPSEAFSMIFRKINVNGFAYDPDNQPLAMAQANMMIAKIMKEAIEKEAKATR